jgi:hypothetical protein
MPTLINQTVSTASALTITLASLASSTTNVGRQSTEVDLSGLSAANAYPTDLTINYKITLGTTPTGNRAAYFFVLWGDGTHRDGNAGASDAGFTIPNNLQPDHVAANLASPATGDILQGSFTVRVLNRRFTVAVAHDTGVALNSTGGNHYIQYHIRKPEIQ